MPEIGLNGLLLDYPNSGTAVYMRNIVPLLPLVAPDLDFRLYVRRAEGKVAVDAQRLSSPFAHLNAGHGPGARLDKFTWEVVSLPLAAAMRREALLHYLYFAAPPVAACPLVVTVHDLIPLVMPGYHRSRQSALYSRFMARTVTHAAAILTVSQHSKKDIVRHLGIPESRIHVTLEAVDERFHPDGTSGERERVRERYNLPDRFLLYTGGAERRKNLEMLVRAWARVTAAMRSRQVGLVIVADFPPPDLLYPDVPRLAAELDVAGDIRFVRGVDEQDKPALYRSALGFCFPSRYEGFGFTPLEAMASGLPVIASRAASIPEVVGDAGWLLSPDDDGAWAEAMLRLVDGESERRELRERGLERARRFCWRRTAEETAAVYRAVIAR